MSYFKDKNGGLHYLDDDAFTKLLPAGSVKISDDDATKMQAPTDAQKYVDLQSLAQIELAKSDTVAMRCFESAIALPAEWVTYRKALRAVIGNPAKNKFPDRPAYPQGT